MTTLRLLTEQLEQLKQAENTILTTQHPVLTNVTIYSHNNILIQSEHFTLDIYSDRTYTEDDIRMNCNIQSATIPTEQESIAQIKAMHTEKALFMKAVEYTQQRLSE